MSVKITVSQVSALRATRTMCVIGWPSIVGITMVARVGSQVSTARDKQSMTASADASGIPHCA